MSITISITDPHLLPPAALYALNEYLCNVVGQAAPAVAPPASASATQFVPPVPPAPGIASVPAVGSLLPPVPTLPAVGTNLDARGYPWDARIHAESRSRNNDGTWRYRRGVKDDVIEPVELELRGVMGRQTEADTAQAVPQEGEPVAASDVPPAPAASDVPPPPPAAPTPNAPNGPSAGDDFNHLANIATKALAAKTITQAQITAILGEIGQANGCVLPHLGALFTRKDLIPVAREKIQAAIAAGGAQ